MLFMDKKNKVYEVTVASSGTCQSMFDNMLEGQHLIGTSQGFLEWFDDDLVDTLGGLPTIDKFKLYELMNKDSNSLKTVSECLIDCMELDNVSQATTDEKLDFIKWGFEDYYCESVMCLPFYSPYTFDMFDLFEFLQNHNSSFNYAVLDGKIDNNLIYNVNGKTYKQATINYYNSIINHSLVEVDSVDDDCEFKGVVATLSSAYNPEWGRDKLTAYMKDTFQALPAKKQFKIVLA